MSFAGAFVVLDVGAALHAPFSRGARSPAGVCEQGRGTGWIAWEPVRSTRPPREGAPGPRAVESGQALGEAPSAPTGPKQGGQRVEPGSERHKRPGIGSGT